jgi:hypothetical protein
VILDNILIFKRDKIKFILKNLEPDNVTSHYVEPLKETNYIEHVPPKLSVVTQKEYVQKINDSKNSLIFGLFTHDNHLIGTSGVQINFPSFKNYVNNDSKYLTLGILVIDKENRGSGFGIMLVWAVSYLLNSYYCDLNIYASMKKDNIASLKSFTSVGYEVYTAFNNSNFVRLKQGELILPNTINDINLN